MGFLRFPSALRSFGWSIFCCEVVPARRGLRRRFALVKCSVLMRLLHQRCALHFKTNPQSTRSLACVNCLHCPGLQVYSSFVLELSIIIKIKGGPLCIVYSRKEQCKISSTAVQIPCYFWYLTSAEKIAKPTGCFHFYYALLFSYKLLSCIG